MFFKVLRLALKEKEPIYLSKVIPFTMLDDDLLITHNSNCVSVISVGGKDYHSLEDEQKMMLYENVKSFLNSLPNEVTASIIIQKKRFENKKEKIALNLLEEIANKHDEQFKQSYSHSYFIIISSSSDENLTDTIIGGSIKKSLEHNKELVRTQVQKAINFLTRFDPSILKGVNLLEFYYYQINAKSANLKYQKYDIEDLLSASEIEFKDDHIKYNDKRYSSFISIVAYENESDTSEFIKELLSLKLSFTITQILEKLSPKKTKDFIQRREKYIQNFHDSIGDDEFFIIKDALLKNEESLFRYTFFVQAYSDNLNKLDIASRQINAIIERYGYNSKIETKNIPCLYHASLCENEHYAVRRRIKVASNIASLNEFAKTKNGLDACSFGTSKTATFFNISNNYYNFAFHESSKDRALGNSIIVGGSSSGKTTLMSFLITSALEAYPDLNVVAFDKHRGMQTFTEVLGMNYTDFNNDIHLNPMNLKDTPINREFLTSFFKIMSRKDDMQTINKIQNALTDLFSLSQSARSLEHIKNSFGISENEEDIASIVKTYIDGANARFFSSKDSLDFEKRLSVFNMDSIFKNTDALSLISMYIFHKLYAVSDEKDAPFMIFVDEALSYFENPFFAKRLEEQTLEVRKKNGIIIYGVQDYKQFLRSEYSRSILGASIATAILFPDPTADEKYKETFKLTASEFKFIKENSKPYHVLVKKQNVSESIILNVNLSSLGKYLKIFDSSSSTVANVLELKKQNKLEEFLA